jgi:hypothetical protein
VKRARANLLLVLSLGLAACGEEPAEAPAPGPGEKVPAAPQAPRATPFRGFPPSPPDVEEIDPHPLEDRVPGFRPRDPRPEDFPRPEADAPAASGLGPEEAALAGTYRLREYIAMADQVPGGQGRLTGTLTLFAEKRRVQLHVVHAPLSDRYMGGGKQHFGGGRWRLADGELVFEPFRVDGGEPLAGPWVDRWKVVRDGDRILLRAGEFTYERTPPP